MIIRKPYEFLIKNFRKVHIFLLVLFAYLYYSSIRINAFIKEFLELETYDMYNEPITKYITPITIIALIIMILISGLLILLLKKKDKPWKLYLVPVIEYLYMLIIYIFIINYFSTYNGQLDLAYFKAIKDLLFISRILQFPVLIIYGMRVFGLDLNKFNFKTDTEYLELDEDDQDELEINIQFDKHSIKRSLKRFFRNGKYVYLEHKFIINIILVVITFLLGIKTYKFIFVTNRSYKLGDTFDANGYTIKVKDSYYTNKDYRGNVINKNNAFVILNLEIKNNDNDRIVDLSKFHIMNGIANHTYTAKTYGTEFQDFGKTYNDKKIKKGKTINQILVYDVDKKLPINKFVLYYQEISNNNPHLRKIKLKTKDLSEIKAPVNLNILDPMKITIAEKEETIIIDGYKITNEVEYIYNKCSTSNCKNVIEKYKAPNGHKILQINFATDTYESEEIIDFLTKYGKINYIDNSKKVNSIFIKNALPNPYFGKTAYIDITEEILKSPKLEIEFIVRNNRFIYKLK